MKFIIRQNGSCRRCVSMYRAVFFIVLLMALGASGRRPPPLKGRASRWSTSTQKAVSKCNCWNATVEGSSGVDENSASDGNRASDATDNMEVEVACKCRGTAVHRGIPPPLASKVQRLVLVGSMLEVLVEGALQPYRNSLRDVILMNTKRLRTIDEDVFKHLPELRTMYIHNAPAFRKFANETFYLDAPNFRILRVVNTGLETMPNLSNLATDAIMHMIDLENNRLGRVTSHSVRVQAEQFLLNYNLISTVENEAFHGSHIAKLSLKGNRLLTTLHPGAFVGLHSLRELDLSETSILGLPTRGLRELEILRLERTYTLKVFPSVYNFESIREAWLTYPYHCCAFQFPATHDPEEHLKHERFIAHVRSQYCSTGTPNSADASSTTTAEPLTPTAEETQLDSAAHQWEKQNEANFHQMLPSSPEGGWMFGSIDDTEDKGGGGTSAGEGVFHQTTVLLPPTVVHAFCGNLTKPFRDVQCRPSPDAFSPCEDLLGHTALRAAAWFVAIAALVGNVAVLAVVASCGRRCHLRLRVRLRPAAAVQRLLMAHLAFADFCMGAYLLFLAAMDLRSRGAYFNYALDWQRGAGCQVAGFLTIFASELSVFTLTLLTAERWYTITYALHLTRRMRINTASRIMAVGWCYSLAMAILPLMGISSYSKTSICLPMEHGEVPDLVYLATLLTSHAAAFIFICACYARMYWAIRGQGRNSRQQISGSTVRPTPCSSGRAACVSMATDLSIAKKMALLVFTDFACWVPIVFFGLTALAGRPLIDVSHAKILLVFFYPLNACANPYLYALLTKQFQRELTIMLSSYGLCPSRPIKSKPSYSPGGVGEPLALLPRSGSAQTPRGSYSTTLTHVTFAMDNARHQTSAALYTPAEVTIDISDLPAGEANASADGLQVGNCTCCRRLSVVLESSRTSESADEMKEKDAKDSSTEDRKSKDSGGSTGSRLIVPGSPHPLRSSSLQQSPLHATSTHV